MSGGYPLVTDVCNLVTYESGVKGTSVTCGSVNTKGSWTQLTASTTADCVLLSVFLSSAFGTRTTQAVDIGIGAAASEVVVLSNLLSNTLGFNSESATFYQFPIEIPSGTRISARGQSATAADTVIVGITTADGSYLAGGAAGCDAVGFNSAASLGTAFSCPNGSKGSYVQLTASTSRDYCGFWLVMDDQNTQVFHSCDVDIAIGGSGSEKIIVPDVVMGAMGPALFFPICIPAGTAVSVRGQNFSTIRNFGMTLFGVYQ